MKALCIIGSPRHLGCTTGIVDAIVKGMENSGIEVKKHHLNDLDIKYCQGCMTCHKTRSCVQEDDVAWIMSDLMDSDVVLVASPSYWGDITGQLKVFIDRNTPYGNTCEGGTLIPTGKVGVAVAIRAGQRKEENQHIVDTINHYFSHLEIRPIQSITIEGVMNREDLLGHEEKLKEAYLLGYQIGENDGRRYSLQDR